MTQTLSDIKLLKRLLYFPVLGIVAILLIVPSIPVQANTRSTQSSCQSSNGRFDHPDRQSCQPRRPHRRGR